MFKLPILIRKIKYREKDNMPRMFRLSLYHLISALQGNYCVLKLQPEKGEGIQTARIDRHEKAFVKFLKANYGVGEYSVVICRGGKGFKLMWRGTIEKDRYIRKSGSMSPYILTHSPIKAWHELKDEVEL